MQSKEAHLHKESTVRVNKVCKPMRYLSITNLHMNNSLGTCSTHTNSETYFLYTYYLEKEKKRFTKCVIIATNKWIFWRVGWS